MCIFSFVIGLKLPEVFLTKIYVGRRSDEKSLKWKNFKNLAIMADSNGRKYSGGRRQPAMKGSRAKSGEKDAAKGLKSVAPAEVVPVVVKTEFSEGYGRPGFPMRAVYGVDRPFRWLVSLESIDYELYMPVLIDGLRDRDKRMAGCAAQGLRDLFARDELGDRVLAALPRVVFPLRRVLHEGPRYWPAVVRGLRVLRALAAAGQDGRVGRALVPYYRQLLPPLGRYRQRRIVATDGLNENTAVDVADLCDDTLTLLQRNGGPCAYVNIKYILPTYELVVTSPPTCLTATKTRGIGPTAVHVRRTVEMTP